jgi:hypothetical protein
MNSKLKALGASSYLMSMSTLRNPKLMQWVTKPSYLKLSIFFSLLSTAGSLFTTKVIMCNKEQGYQLVYVILWSANLYFILETALCVLDPHPARHRCL